MSTLQKIISKYKFPEKIKIRDTARVNLLLEQILAKGPDALQVITDFDHTLTKFKTPDGNRADTCHGIIDHCTLVPESFRSESRRLFEFYYPIEIDHELTTEEKIPQMIEWYEKSHDLLASVKLSKSDIEQMVKTCRAYLRDSAREVLANLASYHVPVLIFSAGVGDVIEQFLIRDNALFDNVKVVSNYMDFDESGHVKSFKKPLIHMFNKNENALDHSAYFEELSHRHNALVLGDSLGDVGMDTGMAGTEDGSILKIGFLNDKIEERMKAFLESFDIVLVDDQSFEFVKIITDEVLTKPSKYIKPHSP